jgi:PPOX class probable FMN-dependent enzyme
MDAITDPEALRAFYGPVAGLAANKTLPKLDPHCRAFIALSPFLVLATSDGQGGMDASPRGDAPGFVLVLDDHTLLLPDRPGNKRVDSYNNVMRHPAVGLLFLVPGIDETVRVNGTARLITDADLLTPAAAHGKIPAAGLLITVQEAFFHCAKALIRSKLWDPATRVPRASFPTLGRIIADQTKMATSEESDARINKGYHENLY